MEEIENRASTTFSEHTRRRGRPRRVIPPAKVKAVLRELAEPHCLHPELWSLSSARLRHALKRDYKALAEGVGAHVVDATYHHGRRDKARTMAWSIPFLDEELGRRTTHEERLGTVEQGIDADGRRYKVVLTEVRREVLLRASRDPTLDSSQRRLLRLTLHRGRLRPDGRFVVRELYRNGEERPQDKRKPDGRQVRTPRLHVVGGGIQGIAREIREQMLSGLGYFELDLKNAHPVIAYALAGKLGLATPTLSRYVHHRDEVIDEISADTAAPRKATKDVILAVFNGGSLKCEEAHQLWQNLAKHGVPEHRIPSVASAIANHPTMVGLMTEARSLLPEGVGPGGLWFEFTDFEQLLMDEVILMVGEENIRVLIHDGLVVAGQVPEAELEGFKAWGHVLGIDPELVVLKQVEL